MTDMRASLILTGDSSGLRAATRDASGEVRRLSDSAERTASSTNKARDALGRFTAGAGAAKAGVAGAAAAAGGAAGQFDRLTGSAQRASSATGSMTSQLRSLVAVVGGALVVRQVIQWADAWKLTEGRLSLVTKSALELKAVQSQLFDVSQRTGQAFGGTATLYTRLAQATAQLGTSQRQLLAITETINQAFVVSGAGAAEAQAAIVQLSQAIASGVLRGDEFNSVMEQAPRLSQALSDSLGKTRGELRAMAEQGQLTVQMILKALTEEAPKIGQEFARMPLTVGRALTQLGNSLQRLVGLSDAASGATTTIAGAISDLAKKLAEPQVVEAVARFAEALSAGLQLAIDAAVALAPHIDTLAAAVAGLVAINIGIWLQGAILGMRALAIESLAFVATPFGMVAVAIGLVVAGVSALVMANAEAAAQEKALADAMKVTDDARRLSSDKIKEMTSLERQLTAEKQQQAIATQQQALAERLRYQDQLQGDLDKERSYMSPLYDENDKTDPANTFGRIPTLKNQLASNWEQIDTLRQSILDAKIALQGLLNGEVVADAGAGSGSSDTGLVDKIKKARAQIQDLAQSIADLSAQKIAIDGGGLEGLDITKDAQKATAMLLEFGQAAKLGTDDLAGLERAAGVTVEQIAAWLADQRQLNKAIDESVDLLTKQAEAPKTFAKYIADLEQQNEELRLELNGRKALIPLLRAEVELKEQLGRPITAEERGRLKALLDDQTKLNAAIDRQKEITDAAKKSAEMMQEPFKKALQGSQQAWSAMFRKILDGNVKSFKDFGRSLLDVFKQLAAEIATLLIFRPIVSGVLSNLGMGDLSSQLGLGSGNGGASTGGTGGGILSGSLNGGQLNTGIGSMFFGNAGTPAIGGPRPSAGAPATSGMFGSGGAGGLGGMLNSPVGGGIFSGLMAGATTYASGGSAGESIGAGVGGAIGGIAGSYFGPVGSMIGATVGSMLGKFVGGMFGKKEKWKKQKSVAGATLGFNDLGMLDVDGTFAYTKGKGMKADNQAGGKLGNAMSHAFNDFFLDLGATFDPSAEAQVQEVYQSKVKGKKKKGEKHYFYGSFADQYIGTSETAEQFVPQFLSGSLAVAAEKGLVSGVSETILTIFKNAFKNNDNMGIQDADELTKMVDFGKFYDRVDEIRTPAIAAANALTDLKKALASAKSTAEEYGLSVEHVTEVFRQNFADSVDSEILQIKDPQAYAMAELEKEYEARKAVATELGLDLANVEELYALKRKAIVEAGLNEMQDSFREFFDELTLGDLAANTPTQKLSQAQGRFNDVVAANDNANFVEAARDYLQVAKGYYGATEAYAKIYDQIVELTRKLGNIPGFAGGGVASGLSWVGEQGPELINAGSSSMVINARMAGQLVNRYHTNGDTMVAHINDNEAKILKAFGGSGTVNPMTGLLQFGGGGGAMNGKDGSGVGGHTGGGMHDSTKDGGQANRDSVGGGIGSNKNGPTDLNSMMSGTESLAKVKEKNKQAVNDNEAYRDYAGVGDTILDQIGNFFAGLLGFNEINPYDQSKNLPSSNPNAPSNTGQASWGFDPVGAIVGAIGMGLGFPGLGLIADQISSALGRPFEMNLGPDVLGGTGGSMMGGSSSTGSGGGTGGGVGDGHDGGSDGLISALTGGKVKLTGDPANDNKVAALNQVMTQLMGGSASGGLASGAANTENHQAADRDPGRPGRWPANARRQLLAATRQTHHRNQGGPHCRPTCDGQPIMERPYLGRCEGVIYDPQQRPADHQHRRRRHL
ncbi:MAG: tape measure protein [Rhodospirillaceae bacterium]|nr:tape measure protein [Rhodospirillaceae bacterium]